MAERGESRSATRHLQHTETDADRQETATDPAGPRQTNTHDRQEFDTYG